MGGNGPPAGRLASRARYLAWPLAAAAFVALAFGSMWWLEQREGAQRLRAETRAAATQAAGAIESALQEHIRLVRGLGALVGTLAAGDEEALRRAGALLHRRLEGMVTVRFLAPDGEILWEVAEERRVPTGDLGPLVDARRAALASSEVRTAPIHTDGAGVRLLAALVPVPGPDGRLGLLQAELDAGTLARASLAGELGRRYHVQLAYQGRPLFGNEPGPARLAGAAAEREFRLAGADWTLRLAPREGPGGAAIRNLLLAFGGLASLAALLLAGGLAASRRRLVESEARFRDFAGVAADWFWEVDRDGAYQFISARHEELTGIPASRLLGRTRWEVLAEAGVDAGGLEDQRRRFEAREPFESERDYRDAQGRWRVLRTAGRPFHDARGRFAGYRGIGSDVTETRRVRDRLREAAAVFDSTAEAVMILDPQRRIQQVNTAFADITGYEEPDVVGESITLLRPEDEPSDAFEGIWGEVARSGQARGETRERLSDGRIAPVWQCISEVRDETGTLTHYVRVVLDISTLKEYQSRMEHLAHHDALTGLPNRMLLGQRLGQSIQRARRHGGQGAVLFLDLDGFKKINDGRGHAAGDALLREVAGRLSERLRASDTVARVAGDEFLVVLDEVAGPEAAARVAAELAERVSEPVRIEDGELLVTTSVGVALFPDDGEDAGTLTRNADAAMYRAKQAGRNRYCLYTREITAGVERRLEVERRLRQALQDDTLAVHYQPQFSCRDRRLVGAEALARWHDPELGDVPPSEFIRAAEDAGMVEALDQWVMQTAAEQVVAWDASGLWLPSVAVNVSGRGVERGTLPTSVQGVLAFTGIEPHRLELEVIETHLLAGQETAERLHAVRGGGVRLAVDDFGTGYSSLAYLRELPADRLKIDRSFVARIDRDEDAAIVEAVVAMAHSLGMSVVAEGVETEAQLAAVVRAGCDAAQGYLLGRPRAPDAFAAALQEAPEGAAGG